MLWTRKKRLIFDSLSFFPASFPGQPRVSVVFTTATSISLTWSVPSDSVVTSYEVTWQELSSDGSFISTSDSITDTSYTIEKLEISTDYNITVTVINAVGSTDSHPLIISTGIESIMGPCINTYHVNNCEVVHYSLLQTLLSFKEQWQLSCNYWQHLLSDWQYCSCYWWSSGCGIHDNNCINCHSGSNSGVEILARKPLHWNKKVYINDFVCVILYTKLYRMSCYVE